MCVQCWGRVQGPTCPHRSESLGDSPHELLKKPRFMLQEWDFSGGKSAIRDAGSALCYQVGDQDMVNHHRMYI